MSSTPSVVDTVALLRDQVTTWRNAGETIALVPTMGALHEGHLSLVKLAKEMCDRAVVSIFINPRQFAPTEDLDTYPRDEAGDMSKLKRLETDLVYVPSASVMYPPGFSTRVEVSGLSEDLCGISRPHFFGGVATIVSKLLIQCLADIAIFGEKDYQQLLVIRQMARDLDIPTEIIGGAIIREEDGLAMSSRNAYLSKGERKLAPLLHATLCETAACLGKQDDIATTLAEAGRTLSKAGFALDYLEVRHADTLVPIKTTMTHPARIFVAAMLGKTRLIDNMAIPERS